MTISITIEAGDITELHYHLNALLNGDPSGVAKFSEPAPPAAPPAPPAPEPAEKPKRVRRTKAQIEADKKAASAPAATPEPPAPAAAPAPVPATVPGIDELRAAVQTAVENGGLEKVQAAFKAVGADNLTAVSAENIPTVIAALNE